MLRHGIPAAVLALAVAAMISPGCSCGDDTSTATSSSGSTTGAGGAGGEGGDTTSTSSGGGQGGQGGTMPVDPGMPASETVNAGQTVTSTNYRMVFTFGQPTQNQGTTTSTSYRMQGGLIGANGSTP